MGGGVAAGALVVSRLRVAGDGVAVSWCAWWCHGRGDSVMGVGSLNREERGLRAGGVRGGSRGVLGSDEMCSAVAGIRWTAGDGAEEEIGCGCSWP